LIPETKEQRIRRLKITSNNISNLIHDLIEQGKTTDEIKMMFYKMVDVVSKGKEERMN
jgi:hypothetical protein